MNGCDRDRIEAILFRASVWGPARAVAESVPFLRWLRRLYPMEFRLLAAESRDFDRMIVAIQRVMGAVS